MTRRIEFALLAACSIVYLAVATRISDGLFRRQFDNGAYAHFFDYQAEALLRGDLALPRGAIGIEAFVVNGHDQMYFGLFPAFIRMPILAVTDALFGDLTLLSSFAAWLVFVLSAWALADRVLADLISANAESPIIRWSPWAWKITVALGSPMLMLAGPAWVFSEAIMWGVAAAMFFQYRLFCELRDSSAHNQWLLGAALVLAVLNRPTQALGCFAVVVALITIRSVRRREFSIDSARLTGMTVVAAVLMVLPNWLRFRRLFGLPMDAQLLSQVEDYRVRMLAYAGNDYTDIRYLPSNMLAYLRPDGMSIDSKFPFLNAPREIPTVFFGAVHDITNRTPSIVASSPLLFALAVIGLVLAVVTFRTDAARRRVAFLACAGIPAAGAHMVWGFITPRFLADFVPFLLPLSLIGFAAAVQRIGRLELRGRRVALTALGLLTVWSVAANIGLALGSSYYTGYDGDVTELVALQRRSDFWTDTSTERFATVADFEFDRDSPPPPDTIAVLGDCEAAYISSGEQVDPWLTLGYGAADFRQVFDVTMPADLEPTSIHLATFDALQPPPADKPGTFHVALTVRGDGDVQLELSDEFGFIAYPLDAVGAGDDFELAITSDPVRRVMFFEVDGRTVAYGHHLTRSLYTEGGQESTFSDSTQQGGIELTLVDPEHPC